MITRIVILRIKGDKQEEFKSLYAKHHTKIKAQSGCSSITSYRKIGEPSTYVTISEWRSLADLETYRNSEYFGGVWPQVKALLADDPEVHSMTTLY